MLGSFTVSISPHRMTGELRESLAKLAKTHAERAKVSVRKARQKGMADLRKTKSVSEDTVHRLERYVGGVSIRGGVRKPGGVCGWG